MASLHEVARQLQDAQLVVTSPYKRWLYEHDEDGYPDAVAEWVGEQLKKPGRDRRNSFSASSGGTCLRAQEFQYIGAPSNVTTPATLQNLFNDGKWRHLRWQAALLTMGVMVRAEVPLIWKKKRLVGSADGLLVIPDDHPNELWRGKECGFELKGMSPFVWNTHKAHYDNGIPARENIKTTHLSQVARYSLISGWDLFCVVYENKATQEWVEMVIDVTPAMLREAQEEIDALNFDIDREYMAPRLEKCEQQKGGIFNDCPYGGSREGACIRVKDWPSERQLKQWSN